MHIVYFYLDNTLLNGVVALKHLKKDGECSKQQATINVYFDSYSDDRGRCFFKAYEPKRNNFDTAQHTCTESTYLKALNRRNPWNDGNKTIKASSYLIHTIKKSLKLPWKNTYYFHQKKRYFLIYLILVPLTFNFSLE